MNDDKRNAGPAMLETFTAFVRNADWETVRGVLDNHQVPGEQFYAVIPQPVAEFALFLRTPLVFEALVARSPATAREQLDAAKATADTQFSGLEQHPVVQTLMQSRVRAVAARSDKQESAILTEFTQFQATPLWLQDNEELLPATTITIRGVANEILFRATLDWDDLSFLAFVFLDLLKDEFVRAGRFKAAAVRVVQPETIAERLSEIKAVIHQLEESATAVGLRVGKTPSSTHTKSKG